MRGSTWASRIGVDPMAFAASDPARAGRPRAAIARRALTLWPRLDPRALSRCGQDIDALARLVSRRTSLPPETIRRLLAAPPVSREDGEIWFG